MTLDADKANRTIGAVLRAGVILSVAVVLAGGIWFLTASGHQEPGVYAFHGEPRHLTSPLRIAEGAFAGQPASLIQLGLLLLILTPVARVALSVVVFVLERDRLYSVLTLIVLTVLVATLIWPV